MGSRRVATRSSVKAVAYVVLVCLAGCGGADKQAERSFHEGREQVTRGRYDDGMKLLREYLDGQPGGRFASRADFLIGKALIGQGKFDEGTKAFRQVIEKYPKSLEAHKSRYKLALVDMLAGREAEANKEFADLAARKDGPLTPEATAMSRWLDERVAGDDAKRPEPR